MKLYVLFIGACLFLIGWLASDVYSSYTYEAAEEPIDTAVFDLLNTSTIENESINDSPEKADSALEQFLAPLKKEERNKASPQDWIPMDNIHVYNNRVIIEIDDPEWALFTDTKSMDPVIDSTSNAIEVIPKSPDQIEVGDIVAYRSKYATGVITHRVVEIDSDSNGWYARLKGDNNDRVDPGKVRFDQIERVVVAIIY